MEDRNGMEHSEKNGQFVSKGNTDTEAEQKRAEELTGNGYKKPSIAEYLGNKITGVQGQDAINALIKAEGGYVVGAFSRPELPAIDLLWGKGGKDGFGLAHIIEERASQGINTSAFLSDLAEVIENGKIDGQNEFGRVYISGKGKTAVISMLWDKEKVSFLITAFDPSVPKHSKKKLPD